MFFHLFIGAIAGLHAACYGAYKDSPYEQFILKRFIREIIIGVFSALIITLSFKDASITNKGILFLVFLATSRVITEAYKQFIRVESQKNYKIPSQVHFFKTIVSSRLWRLMLGLGLFIYLYLIFLLSKWTFDIFPLHSSGAIIGLLAGLSTAFGGGYKDGFYEGFEKIKFFRSPVVSLIAGFSLSFITNNVFFLLFASLGFERMIVECYKGFFKFNYVPGKFKITKPKFPQELKERIKFIPIYIFTWIFLILLLFL